MKLSLGICGLCAVNDKVVVAWGAKKITTFVPQTLQNLIGISKFDEISSTLKLCTFCLAHMLQVAQYEEKLGRFSALNHRCSICRSFEHLVNIKEWIRFDGLLENINAERRGKCAVCLPCIAYLERLDVIKSCFLKKFPNLQKTSASKGKIKEQRNIKKVLVSSESDSEDKLHNGINTDLNPKKKRNCKRHNPGKDLKHLKPLKNSGLKIEQYKSDSRLLEQVAFVSLKTSKRIATVADKLQRKSSSSCTNRDKNRLSPVPTPSFKIKLIAKKHKKKNAAKEEVTLKRRVKKSKLIENPNQQTPKTKKLIVRVLRANLDELKKQFKHTTLEAVSKTPSEASTEIAREKTKLDSKKKKNVSFAEDITICDETARTSPIDSGKTEPLDLILSKEADEELNNRATHEHNLEAAFKRKRVFSDDTDSEGNPENDADHSHSVNEKRRKSDPFDELKYGSNSDKKNVPSTDNENISGRKHSLATNEKENGDSLDLRAELIVSEETDNDNDNALSCNGNKAKFTAEEQLNDDKSKEDVTTVDPLIVDLSGTKSDTSSEDTIITLAEYKKMKSADGSALSIDAEDSSGGCQTECIKSKEDIIDSSQCEEEELTEQNEEPVETKTLQNSKEKENTSGAVEATQNAGMDDYEDDYSPESLEMS